MHLLTALERFFRHHAPSGCRLLVAFSGGPDSTALLWGLTRLAPALDLDLVAAHLDHRLDADSERRAEQAGRLAAALGVPLVVESLEPAVRPAEDLAAGEGVEAFARRRRYEFLTRVAAERRARFIATAHQAEDQAETVILRLLFGTGVLGLAAIRPVRGLVLRPLLDVPHEGILEAVTASGLEPVSDPTNADLDVPRNLVRHHLLPRLVEGDPSIVARLCALARAAAAAARRVEEVLTPVLVPRPLAGARGVAVHRRALQDLPEPLFAPALALLARRAGACHPPGAPARRELRRQLEAGPRLGCDCGDGWRWEGDLASLRLLRDEPPPGRFAYTLRVPGEVEIPELALKVRLRRGRVEPWMFRGRADRAGLASSLPTGTRVEIRNRRPGDRIQPLGGKERIRLKDLLIARRIPRHLRDRLPLLVIDGVVAWVPGVTIDERFRLGAEETTWIAEVDRGSTTGAGETPQQSS